MPHILWLSELQVHHRLPSFVFTGAYITLLRARLRNPTLGPRDQKQHFMQQLIVIVRTSPQTVRGDALVIDLREDHSNTSAVREDDTDLVRGTS